MILSMSGQAILFFTTVIVGFAIGFAYDIFRILRKTLPHSNFVVQLEDIVFWLGVTFLMFYFMLHQNYGEIRLFSIAGAALGALIYFCSLSILIMKVSETVIKFLQELIIAMARIIFTPIRLLLPPCKWLFRLVRKRLLFVRQSSVKAVRGTKKNIAVMLKKV